ATDRGEMEQGVEGGHPEHADERHVEPAGDHLDRRPADPAILLLHPPQERNHRRALPPGGAVDDRCLHPLLILGREGKRLGLLGVKTTDSHQRSISPNTMSREPRIADTSASMCPLERKSMAARWAKLGARILQR